VYVADNLWFIALYWAAFSAFCALLSSHMTNKDDDDNDDEVAKLYTYTNINSDIDSDHDKRITDMEMTFNS